MNYEIVNLEEKTVAGFSARTNNTSSDMGKVIGGLWQRLYSPDGCFTLKTGSMIRLSEFTQTMPMTKKPIIRSLLLVR